MSTILRVQWTIEPLAAPQPHLPCSHCGRMTAFRSSGTFRLNANGKRLDAWLIYRCLGCDGTWNRPVFERLAIGTIDPDQLNQLQANDAGLAAAIAFDGAGLRRFTSRVEPDGGVRVLKQVIIAVDSWTALEITMVVLRPVSVRLDRLLARELGMSRERVKALVNMGRLRVGSDGWRRGVRDGDRVVLDYGGDVQDRALGVAAGEG
ncbi:MAG: DUF1062 domain-containing protein [Steroidobacteraceae bacterium]|nr:DUF1062 domain-containing protein [Steroidobacteraceae bacterium]